MRIFVFVASLILFLNAEDVYAIFNVEASKDAKLTLDSSGIVQEIFADVGTRVKKGDILLSLSNEDKKENIKIQQAQSDATQQQYIFAKKQYDRYKKSAGAVDRNTLDKYYFDYKNLESNFLKSKLNVSYQKELLKKTILLAPFDGIIAAKNIQLGDGVAQNNTVLFRLISPDSKLVLEFDSKYINSVTVGSEFEFVLNNDGKVRKVVINKIYPVADGKTRKVKAEAMANGVVPGTFGDGYIRIK